MLIGADADQKPSSMRIYLRLFCRWLCCVPKESKDSQLDKTKDTDTVAR